MVSQSTNKKEIYNFLSKDACSSLYFIGDLNDSEFNKCKWFINGTSGSINALLLIYPHPVSDTILTIGNPEGIENILSAMSGEIPPKFHAHFFLEHESIFKKYYKYSEDDIYLRMCLNPSKFIYKDGNRAVRLGTGNHEDILILLKTYPENFYTQEQLVNGYYYGIYEDSKLVSMCGTHIASEEYGICALGNIVTAVDYRNRGYSNQCISALINSLPESISAVGLNVRISNGPAINLYSKTGFEEHRRLFITYCS
jgi:hypothetical protein